MNRFEPEIVEDRIERELERVLHEFSCESFSRIQPALTELVCEFLARKGKRLRPRLFILMNSAYSEDEVGGIYRSAIALELLHNFVLIHDDIVDNSELRRNKPSMHRRLREAFKSARGSKISAESMAMIIGDMVYAYATGLFMSADVPGDRKIAALKYLTDAALFTAAGELRELANTYQPFEELTLESILQASQWKTAYYSFLCPMATGAVMAGAGSREVELISGFALLAGLAYQIHDDICDIDLDESELSATQFNDIRDGKQTLPIWYTINKADSRDRNRLLAIMKNGDADIGDLNEAREMILDYGGVEFAAKEMRRIVFKATDTLTEIKIADAVKDSLWREIAGVFESPHLRRKESKEI